MSGLSAGIDEVGYGAWAGPIISVVAVFRKECIFPAGVTDSKKTTQKQRTALYLPLCELAVDIGVGHAWPWEIDRMGPLQALQESYRRALDELTHSPETLIVDGKFRVECWKGNQVVEPKADLKYQEVSAASMIAKHLRDTMMADYAKTFPGYGWEKNRGYGTYDHEAAIKKLGLLVNPANKERYLHRLRYCRKALIRGA